MSGKRHAILIASSRFPEEPGLTALRCPENDVDALHEVLASPDFGQFNKVIALKNRPSHEVLEQLEMLLHEARHEDLVLVYFSGHGKLNASNQLCLTTVNTKLKVLGSTSIPIERIKSFFDAADTKKKILILDCCNSGAAGEAFTGTKGSFLDQLQLMSQGQGTFIVTASAKFQIAEEKPGDSLGLFTKHLVDGIRSGEADRDEDGLVDIHELYDHVYERVRAEGAQEPMKWDIHAKGRMIVAKSGKALREQRRQEIERSLHRLAADGLLTSRIVQEAATVLRVPKKELAGSKQQHLALIDQLIGSKIGSADFIEQWMDLRCLGCAVPKPKKDRTIGRYIDHGDGTITDTKTGLMWKRCLEGLSGINCEDGKIEKYTWGEAVERFKNVAYAGYSDWRLPTIYELETLVHCSKGRNNKNGFCNDESEQPTINQQIFPNAEASRVWSGSPYADYLDFAWYVGFYNGLSNVSLRDFNYAVRLVRGGQ